MTPEYQIRVWWRLGGDLLYFWLVADKAEIR